MRTSFYRRALTTAAFVLLTFGGVAAHADEARDQSRAAFRKGVALAKENNYVAARDQFAEAYRLFPHPSILLNLGIARGKSGQIVEAEQDLVKFLADDGGASQEEIRSARQMLADVREKLATLSLDVKTPGAKVTLDGKAFAIVSGQSSPIRATAGTHALHVEAEGYEPHDEKVDLVSKIETPLTVELKAKPTAGGEPGAEPAGGVSRKTLGLGLFAGGAVVAAAGGVFGVMSMRNASIWNKAVDSHDTLDTGLRDRGKLYAIVADVCYGAGAVLGGAGLYFLLVKPKSAATSAQVFVSPRFTGVAGTF